MKQLMIFGDSIMKGVTFNCQKYQLCQEHNFDFLAQRNIAVQNFSKMGATVTAGLSILKRKLAAQPDASDTTVLFSFGGNDCDHNWLEVAQSPEEEHLPNTPLPKFIDTLKEMALSLRSRGIQPMLMTLPPLDAEKYLGFIGRRGADTKAVLSWLGDVQMIYRWQEMYSGAVALLASRLDLPLLDVRSRFLSRRDYTSLIARDGIHLTQAGYELIYDSFRETLPAMA